MFGKERVWSDHSHCELHMLTCVHRSCKRHYRHSGRHRLKPGAQSSNLPIAVLVSCKDYKGLTPSLTLWRFELRMASQGLPIVPIGSFEDLLRITIATDGSNTIALTSGLGSHCPQITVTRPYAAQNQGHHLRLRLRILPSRCIGCRTVVGILLVRTPFNCDDLTMF